MKKFVLLFVFTLVSVSLFSQSKSDDHAAIAKTVNYYLEGGTNGDFEVLKKAFHDDARMIYIKDGEYTSVNVIEFFGGIMKEPRKSNRETRIASIDVSGHAASAKLEIVYSSFKFIDYMQLLKINGEWKIISKTFFRENTQKKEG